MHDVCFGLVGVRHWLGVVGEFVFEGWVGEDDWRWRLSSRLFGGLTAAIILTKRISSHRRILRIRLHILSRSLLRKWLLVDAYKVSAVVVGILLLHRRTLHRTIINRWNRRRLFNLAFFELVVGFHVWFI